MRAHPAEATLQRDGCEALRHASSAGEAQARAIDPVGGVAAVVAAMKLHPRDEAMQTDGARVLWNVGSASTAGKLAVVARGGGFSVVRGSEGGEGWSALFAKGETLGVLDRRELKKRERRRWSREDEGEASMDLAMSHPRWHRPWYRDGYSWDEPCYPGVRDSTQPSRPARGIGTGFGMLAPTNRAELPGVQPVDHQLIEARAAIAHARGEAGEEGAEAPWPWRNHSEALQDATACGSSRA